MKCDGGDNDFGASPSSSSAGSGRTPTSSRSAGTAPASLPFHSTRHLSWEDGKSFWPKIPSLQLLPGSGDEANRRIKSKRHKGRRSMTTGDLRRRRILPKSLPTFDGLRVLSEGEAAKALVHIPEVTSPRSARKMYSAAERGKSSEVAVMKADDPEKGGADDDDIAGDAPGFSWSLFFAYTGPGWLMSIAYVDPGNLESDLQAGAFAKYDLLWVLLTSTLLGLLFQVLAVRLGAVTGRDLAETCRLKFSSAESKILWAMTQIAIIGSDIQEIVGSAVAFRVLFGLPLWAGCLLTGLDTLSFLMIHYLGVRKLEAFFGVLILTMCCCFFATFFAGAQDWGGIIYGTFVPTASERAAVQAVGIIGAVIMPHNIYLHSSLVLSRSIDRTRPEKIKEANFYFTVESTVALLVSFMINAAVVAVFAEGFYSDACAAISDPLTLHPDNQVVQPPFACVPFDGDGGVHSGIQCVSESGIAGTCAPIGLQGAASALRSALGPSSRILWAVGLLAAGQSSTMTGTYAGQFVMEGFLRITVPNWVRLAITRSIALIPATLVAVIANTDSLAADKLDEWLNVLQSVQLPFAMLPLLRFTGDEGIMGEFVNGRKITALGWTIGVLIIAINVYLVVKSASGFGVFDAAWSVGVFLVLMFLYGWMLWRVASVDVIRFVRYCTGSSRQSVAAHKYEAVHTSSDEAETMALDLMTSAKYGATSSSISQ